MVWMLATSSRLAYEISRGLTVGINISYDEALENRVSADLEVRFGGANTTAQRNKVQELPVINALTSRASYRDVRVHELGIGGFGSVEGDGGSDEKEKKVGSIRSMAS